MRDGKGDVAIHAIFAAAVKRSPLLGDFLEIVVAEQYRLFGQIEKFDLDVPFWNMVKATFGYEEENPTLKNFLLRLVLTD